MSCGPGVVQLVGGLVVEDVPAVSRRVNGGWFSLLSSAPTGRKRQPAYHVSDAARLLFLRIFFYCFC